MQLYQYNQICFYLVRPSPTSSPALSPTSSPALSPTSSPTSPPTSANISKEEMHHCLYLYNACTALQIIGGVATFLALILLIVVIDIAIMLRYMYMYMYIALSCK